MSVRECASGRWPLWTVGGVAGLAVLATGLAWGTATLGAAPPAEPDKKAGPPADAKPAKPKPGPDTAAAEEFRKALERLEKQMEQMQKAGPGGLPGGFFPGPAWGNRLEHRSGSGRLGIRVEKPSAVLVDQLELPAGQGLVIDVVMPDSPAAKAKLKPHDILLEVAGKSVPSDPAAFVKQLHEVKADAKVDMVFLRKGRKETVKDVTLPEAKPEAVGDFVPPQIAFPPGNIFPPFPGGVGNRIDFQGAGRFSVSTDDGKLKIRVTGKVADGKRQVEEIVIEDGDKTVKSANLEGVPEKYRAQVKELIGTKDAKDAKGKDK